MTEETGIWERVFFPNSLERREALLRGNRTFAYYTSATTALSIIDNSEVWLRNASLMNDFMEVRHGEQCLLAAWHNAQVGGRLKAILNDVDPQLVNRLGQTFDGHSTNRLNRTYIMCVSEHGSDQTDEDKYGRLSMWRAYGGNTNVCIIMHSRLFFQPSSSLDAYTSPVLYADEGQFSLEFQKVVNAIEANLTDLRNSLTPECWFKQIFNVMHFAVLSTKHPGFSEEREWRVIHSPDTFGSNPLPKTRETVSGVPQFVHKIPLRDIPEEGLELGIPHLVHKIIIGPTGDASPIKETLVEALGKHGIERPEDKIVVSDIPLRR